MPWPGEAIVLRLWETLAEKGVGSLLKPWQLRRESRANLDAKREELLGLAQAQRDADDIKCGRKRLLEGGKVVALPPPLPPPTPVDLVVPPTLETYELLAKAAAESVVADAVRKELNVANAILKAAETLTDEPGEVPEQKVADDWLHRWRDSASTVSAEELQRLWGRLLAGEVKKPGTYSLRTLDFIKNLSQEEALNLSKLFQFMLRDGIIYRDAPDLLQQAGVTLDFLLIIQELNIITGVASLGLSVTLPSLEQGTYRRVLVCHNRALMVTTNDVNKKLTLNVYKLTTLGMEVAGLGTFKANESSLRHLGESIKKMGYDVVLVDWCQIDESRGSYTNPEPL